MTTYYFDTSALVKFYVTERGSHWVDQIISARDGNGEPSNLITIAKIGIVEAAAAIARYHRLGMLTLDQKNKMYAGLLNDSEIRFETITLSNELLHLAANLTQQSPLRGYDAVHLATALTLNDELIKRKNPLLVFVSADNLLCQIAQSLNFLIENPNHH